MSANQSTVSASKVSFEASESCKRDNIYTPNFNCDLDDASNILYNSNLASNSRLFIKENKDFNTIQYDTPNRNPILSTEKQSSIFSPEKDANPKHSNKLSISNNNPSVIKPLSSDHDSLLKSVSSDNEVTKSTIDSKRNK